MLSGRTPANQTHVAWAAWSLSLLLLTTGTWHFASPAGFERIVPECLGSPPFWVYASGLPNLPVPHCSPSARRDASRAGRAWSCSSSCSRPISRWLWTPSAAMAVRSSPGSAFRCRSRSSCGPSTSREEPTATPEPLGRRLAVGSSRDVEGPQDERDLQRKADPGDERTAIAAEGVQSHLDIGREHDDEQDHARPAREASRRAEGEQCGTGKFGSPLA